MSRPRLLRMMPFLAVGLLLMVLTAGSAIAADPLSKPNGPWVTDTQNVSLEGLHSYDQLMARLEKIEATSKGAVEIIEPAYTAKATGRVLPAVKIGDGPRAMMIITQQHGDEFITTEGAMNLIQALAAPSAQAVAIREAITLIVMPRVNVDGFDSTTTGNPWRYNVDPTASGPYSSRNRGYDINRFHPADKLASGEWEHPWIPGEPNPVPEAMAVRELFDEYEAEVFLDMHHQGTYVDSNGDMVTASTLWPTAPGVDPDVQTLAKKVVATAYTALEQYGYANMTLYPGGPEAGIARNRYGLLGAGAVLIELRGSQEQKSQGYIAKTAYQSMMAVVEAFASGDLYDVDPTIAENIPPVSTDRKSINRDLPNNEEEEGA